MKKSFLSVLLSCAAVGGQALPVSADTLAGWITSEDTGSLLAQETASGISTAVMDRGPGLVYNESFPEVYDSSSWSTSGTFPGASNGDYLSFVIDIDSGFTADFNRLRMHIWPDDDGPDTLDLRSSSDNFAASLVSVTGVRSMSGAQVLDWDFSSNPLTGLTGTTELRLFGYGSGNVEGGVFGPDSLSSPLLVNGQSGGVLLDGTVAAVPEPAAYGAFLALFVAGAVITRRFRPLQQRG